MGDTRWGTMNTYEKWMDFSTHLISIMDVTCQRREKIMSEVTGFIEMYEGDDVIPRWESIVDHFDECFDEYRIIYEDGEFGGEFYNQISTIMRAGIDVATGHLGGVIGFTIGDIISMYDGAVSEWVLSTLEITGDEDRNMNVWL
jgi:hypothetical protein